MKKLSVILFIFFAFALSSQTYVDIPWRKGEIIQNGKIEKGIIRLGGDLGAPWLNFSKVYFVKEKNIRKGKHPRRKHIIKYNPAEIEGYNTFTMKKDEKIIMKFRSFDIKVKSGLFGKKKTKKMFLEIVDTGAVNVFLFTPTPSKKLITSNKERKEDFQNAQYKSTYYLQKGSEEKVVPSVECKLIKMFEDCPEVVEKIKNGDFGVKPLNERKKKKGFGKLLGNLMGDNPLENKIFHIVKVYNKCKDKS